MVFSLNGKLGVDLDAVYSSLTDAGNHVLGECIEGSDGNVYQFVRANGVVDQYDAVAIDEAGDAVALTTAVSGAVPTAVGACQVAFTDNDYGWAVRKGQSFSVNALASCAGDVVLYTTTTAGHLDDASADQVHGVRLNETVGGTAASASASAADFMATNY